MASISTLGRAVLVVTLVIVVLPFLRLGNGGSFAQEAELDMEPATPVPLGLAIPPEVTDFAGDWPVALGDLAVT